MARIDQIWLNVKCFFLDLQSIIGKIDYRVSQNNLLIEKKTILTKIECAGAKFSHEQDFGAFDPA